MRRHALVLPLPHALLTGVPPGQPFEDLPLRGLVVPQGAARALERWTTVGTLRERLGARFDSYAEILG